jgi:hypothetical protein
MKMHTNKHIYFLEKIENFSKTIRKQRKEYKYIINI